MNKKIIFQIAALIAIIACAFFLAHIAGKNEAVKSIAAQYGYIGAFFIALICGFNLLVPIPAAAFTPLFMEVGLNLYVTILVISLGVTCADLLAYFIGRVGKQAIAATPKMLGITAKLEHIHARYAWAPFFVLFLFASIVPLPNEILLIPMGLIGYRFWHILPIIFAGNLVFNFLYSSGLIQIFKNLF